MTNTLLVTGIHREELAFGDHVCEQVDRGQIDVMRVPEGVSHARDGTGDEFYYTTKHREIYLQLRQQIRREYKLVIDLHCGKGGQGLYAELFCHDTHLMGCLTKQLSERSLENNVRLIEIIAEHKAQPGGAVVKLEDPKARTWIPQSVWDGRDFCYVGLEVYLQDGERGSPREWQFTCELIEMIMECGT